MDHANPDGPMTGPEAVIELVLDDAYCRELHAEWVAAVGRGWRLARLMTRLFAAAGLGVLAWTVATARLEGLLPGVVFVGIAGHAAWSRRRQFRAWSERCRALPWFGEPLRVVVRDGALVQEKTFAGDPRYQRTGELLRTPNGYLVRYLAPEGTPAPAEAVSPDRASVYLPLRAVRPAMTRAAFERLLPDVRWTGGRVPGASSR